MNPHIQLRDVWSIMRQLWERGLAVCLNPRHTTGKLYALTERGRQVAEQAFGVKVEPVSARVDWKRYGQVVRAKVRKLVLLELRKLPPDSIKTATVIRKRVCEKHLIGLNPTMRALKELEQLGLVRLRPLGARDVRKTDELTRRGAAIVRQLEK
ncbi:MAG: hypothetical protein HYY24_07345 [Verrucomicrobia bacterium]|nr:hypothetical protein [Verrucomicrobiota bacterium]